MVDVLFGLGFWLGCEQQQYEFEYYYDQFVDLDMMWWLFGYFMKCVVLGDGKYEGECFFDDQYQCYCE